MAGHANVVAVQHPSGADLVRSLHGGRRNDSRWIAGNIASWSTGLDGPGHADTRRTGLSLGCVRSFFSQRISCSLVQCSRGDRHTPSYRV